MALKIDCTGDRCLIHIEGDFTIFQAGTFHEEILKHKLNEQCVDKAITIEMNAIEEIDSSAIQLLLALQQQLAPVASSFSLQNLSETAIEAISVLNLNETFGIQDAEPDSLVDSVSDSVTDSLA